MQTVPFSQLFTFDRSSESITPRVAVRIDGTTFGPGVSVGRGVCLSKDGIALRALVGKDVEISNARGVLEILPQRPDVPRIGVDTPRARPRAKVPTKKK